MTDNTANNRRIAKNTLYLYIRMFLVMGISLYTSRVVLQQLGVTDFGIYNLIAGIVALAGFLNATMSGATSRFLTFDIGRGDTEHLEKTFSSAMQLHLAIAAAVIVAGETAGVWFVNTQIDIPQERMEAANWTFQTALFVAAINVAKVPYSATLIAREHMDAYAILEIAYAALKLGIVFLLIRSPFDKLVFYSLLMLAATAAVFFAYLLYCVRKFKECRLRRSFHKDIVKPMLSFSGWDLYGNGCVIAQQQGTNILLNQFFGVALNAASGVATQVNSAVMMFVSNVTTAIRPQIIKRYAAGDIAGMQKLISFAVIVCLFLVGCVMTPLYLHLDYIMAIWLGEVPSHAVDFCRLLLLANSLLAITGISNSVVHASGRIRRISFGGGTLYLSSLAATYAVFSLYPNPNMAYAIWTGIAAIILANSVASAKANIPALSLRHVAKDIALPVGALLVATAATAYLSPRLFPSGGMAALLADTAINFALLAGLLYAVWIVPAFKGNVKAAFRSFS